MDFVGKIRKFLVKLQNLPETRKKIILWSIVAILGLGMGFFWVKGAVESFYNIGNSIKIPSINLPSTNLLQTTTPSNGNIISQVENNQTTDWQTYTNSKYGFEIKYPSDWSARDFESGVALSPKSKPVIQGAVAVSFADRGTAYCKIPFEDYVKIAGPSEIQNYESLNTGTEGFTSTGLKLYQATWNYTDMQGSGKISLPITYFETKPELCGDIEASLNDNNYSDIYNNIISTLKFTN